MGGQEFAIQGKDYIIDTGAGLCLLGFTALDVPEPVSIHSKEYHVSIETQSII